MAAIPGTPAPWFVAPVPGNPRYVFSSVAGRYVLIAFLPSSGSFASDS